MRSSIKIGILAPVESVAGIVFSPDKQQVLLILRRDVPVWVLPGGGIDAGETPEQAVIREILEETGFQVKIDSLVGTYHPINRLAKTTQVFRCSILSGKATTSEETGGVRFFSLSALPQMPPPYPEWIAEGSLQSPPISRRLTSVNYPTLFRYFLSHPTWVIRFLLSRIGIHWNES